MFACFGADERNAPLSLPVQGDIRVDNGSKTSSSSSSGSSSSDSGSSSSGILINYLIDICPILMDMQCHPGLYFYSNVMSYINVFLQILIVIAPQRLGLMQGHSEPEYFL
jgi:hypothetical protein